jgi:hypothetical protein
MRAAYEAQGTASQHESRWAQNLPAVRRYGERHRLQHDARMHSPAERACRYGEDLERPWPASWDPHDHERFHPADRILAVVMSSLCDELGSTRDPVALPAQTQHVAPPVPSDDHRDRSDVSAAGLRPQYHRRREPMQLPEAPAATRGTDNARPPARQSLRHRQRPKGRAWTEHQSRCLPTSRRNAT